MAVFDLSYVTAHRYSVGTTRARGLHAGPGGWARVPRCACGWNSPGWDDKNRRWVHSPRGSIFPDHYANEDIARQVWETEHMDGRPRDDGQALLLASVL